jgi:transposase-like protein
MSGSTRYSPELRKRAVRIAIVNCRDYPSEWAALTAIPKYFGMSPETLRTWVRIPALAPDSPRMSVPFSGNSSVRTRT